MTSTALPLDGIRVLEFTSRLGAYTGRLLADAGADVVLVEPAGGNPLRNEPPFVDDDPGKPSLTFSYYHANKRSVLLDDDDPTTALTELAARCDVILLAPDAANPVPGFDAATGRPDWAPADAIVCVVTAYGITGPYRSWDATHLTGYAMSGLMIEQGPPEGPPVVIPDRPYDDITGAHAAAAIMVALRAEAGRSVEVAAHEVMLHSYYGFHLYTSAEVISGRFGGNSTAGVWHCRDGAVQLVMATDKHWFALLEILGNPPELADPTWGHPSVRAQHEDVVTEVLTARFAEIDRDELVRRGGELGLPCALVNTVGEFAGDPQVEHRGFLVPGTLPDGRTVDFPGAPFTSSRPLLAPYRRPAPTSPVPVGEVAALWADRPARRTPTPISDLRMISLGTAFAGGLPALALGDLGVDVVKLESPVRPDNLRRIAQPPWRLATEPSGAYVSPMYENFNRSSRSLALDMKSPESVELFLRLIEHTDIVLENFGPGVLERWGVGYERMAQINPRLILLSISGYGQTGPRAQALAYGGTIASFLGLTQAYGYPPAVHFDYVAAAHGLYGVLLALEERERSGLGTWIDLGMIESGAATMGTLLLEYTVNGRDSAPRGNRIPGALLSEVVRCMGDDSWLAVEVRDRDALDRLATAVGSDPGADAGAVAAALATWTSHRTADAAMRALQRAGVAAGVVQNAQDVTRDVQLRERGAIVELPHPDLGPIEFAALPYRFDGERPAVRSRTPRLGEHNAEILVDWLGMSEADADGWAWSPAP